MNVQQRLDEWVAEQVVRDVWAHADLGGEPLTDEDLDALEASHRGTMLYARAEVAFRVDAIRAEILRPLRRSRIGAAILGPDPGWTT